MTSQLPLGDSRHPMNVFLSRMETPPPSPLRHPWGGTISTFSARPVCWWTIELSSGDRCWDGEHFGTASGAERKALRVIRSLEAADRARCERMFEVKP